MSNPKKVDVHSNLHTGAAIEQLKIRAETVEAALAELIADLELRARLKFDPAERGFVDCGAGIYDKCKQVLNDAKQPQL